MQQTEIQWTDLSWNPTTGCSKVSPGCAHCYALAVTERWPKAFPNGFKFTVHPERFHQPIAWKKRSRIFVNSMSDLFHEEMPWPSLAELFDVMAYCHWHTFQILTKRAARLAELAPLLKWPRNVWMGVSVETANYTDRIDLLRQAPAAVRFLSVEPLLGPINLGSLDGIGWVIVGGESGSRPRPMDPQWARNIRDQCKDWGVAFFMKQMAGKVKRDSDIPADLFIREFPGGELIGSKPGMGLPAGTAAATETIEVSRGYGCRGEFGEPLKSQRSKRRFR